MLLKEGVCDGIGQ